MNDLFVTYELYVDGQSKGIHRKTIVFNKAINHKFIIDELEELLVGDYTNMRMYVLAFSRYEDSGAENRS